MVLEEKMRDRVKNLKFELETCKEVLSDNEKEKIENEIEMLETYLV